MGNVLHENLLPRCKRNRGGHCPAIFYVYLTGRRADLIAIQPVIFAEGPAILTLLRARHIGGHK